MITQEESQRLEQDATCREVFDLRVFIVGGGFQYAKMFFDAGLKGATCVKDCDVVCFTGGADVDPSFYEEKPLVETYSNINRDKAEAVIYQEALLLKKPMVGICRGSQFLNVMNGGKLWQDVNNHAVRNGHSVIDMRTGEERHNMTSTHHQQMRPGDDAEILATACLSTHKKSAKEEIIRNEPDNDDMEVLWYPASKCLCFQPHPEFMHGECRNFFLDLFDNYVMPEC